MCRLLHAHPSPAMPAVLPLYTDEDLQAQRQGGGDLSSPVSSPTSWLRVDLNPRFRPCSPLCPPHGVWGAASAVQAAPRDVPREFCIGSILWSSSLPLLRPELNPQQISELNLARVLEAFCASWPCGQRQGELWSHSLEALTPAPFRAGWDPLGCGKAWEGASAWGREEGRKPGTPPITISLLCPTPSGSTEADQGLPGKHGDWKMAAHGIPQASQGIRSVSFCLEGGLLGSLVTLPLL